VRLKPSTRTVSIRLPESLIAALKILANKKDSNYTGVLEGLQSKAKADTVAA
jgi:predicted DNA binding CopG/RHH family protein